MLKIVVLARTPRASLRTATIVNVGFLTSMRQPIANILKQSPMKTLLSIKVTESQKGEFLNTTNQLWWSFSVCRRFHFLEKPGAIT